MCDINDFSLIKVIGEGGSSFVILAEVNKKMDNLNKSDMVVLKLCKPYLTEIACAFFDTEGENLRKLMDIRSHTFNYSKYYGLKHCCLFAEGSARDRLIKLAEKENENLTNDVFLYANIKGVGGKGIPEDIIKKASDAIPMSRLVEIREDLKLENFSVIEYIGKSSPTGILEFIMDEESMACSYFIILSYLRGKNFVEDSSPISDGEMMDIIYGISAAAKWAKFILKDIHADNIMRIEIETPRAYVINGEILIFPPGKSIVFVDAQITEEIHYTLSSRLLLPMPFKLGTVLQKQIQSLILSQDRLTFDQIARLLLVGFSAYKATDTELLGVRVKYPDAPIAHW